MSTDCEGILRRFLVLNPAKRCTLEVRTTARNSEKYCFAHVRPKLSQTKKMLTSSPTANHERQVDKCRVRRRRPETSHRACRRLQWSGSNRWVHRVALPEAAARLQVFYSGATHFILLWPTEVMVGMGFSPEEIKDSLLNQKYNEVTATYLLLGRKGDVSLVFLSHQLSHDGRGPSARRPRGRVSPSDWVLVSSNWTIFFPLQSDMLKCSHPSVFCHCLFRYIWG